MRRLWYRLLGNRRGKRLWDRLGHSIDRRLVWSILSYRLVVQRSLCRIALSCEGIMTELDWYSWNLSRHRSVWAQPINTLVDLLEDLVYFQLRNFGGEVPRKIHQRENALHVKLSPFIDAFLLVSTPAWVEPLLKILKKTLKGNRHRDMLLRNTLVLLASYLVL